MNKRQNKKLNNKNKKPQDPLCFESLNRRYENIYSRCYRECYKKDHPAYDGVTMCEEWKSDRTKFFEWFKEHYYEFDTEQMDVDKDILVKGNKVYSPDTCMIVPHSINVMVTFLPDPKYNPKTGKYDISIGLVHGTVKLQGFDTPDAAKQHYAQYKNVVLKTKARLMKEDIPEQLYDAMMSYTITIEDWDS